MPTALAVIWRAWSQTGKRQRERARFVRPWQMAGFEPTSGCEPDGGREGEREGGRGRRRARVWERARVVDANLGHGNELPREKKRKRGRERESERGEGRREERK